jgi:Bcr/CflA subfamily drug resistance transporter
MKNPILFFSYLFLLSCLGQISSDIYLPAFPTIRDAFNTTSHMMQISLSVFMLGFSISHLIYGPISDSTGRKKPLIIGISICIAGSLLCLFSSNIVYFIVGRGLQGIGAGAGAVLFLSILRDVYDGNQLAKISSFLSISRVILLASSPLIGSYLLHFFNWQACFTFLLIYAAIFLICSLCILKETNQFQHLHRADISAIVKNIGSICKHPTFLSYAFFVMLAFGGILAWLTTLPFLLQEVVGLTPVEFGWVGAISGLFFIVGGFINAMIVERFGLDNMLSIGLLIMLIAGIVMLFFGLFHIIDTLVIIVPVIIYIVGSSFIFANAYAGAMHPFEMMAGTAGAVFGFLQILGGAISSFIMSILHSYNQIPLSIILLLSASIALLVQYFVNKTKLLRNGKWSANKIK